MMIALLIQVALNFSIGFVFGVSIAYLIIRIAK